MQNETNEAIRTDARKTFDALDAPGTLTRALADTHRAELGLRREQATCVQK